MKIRCLLIVLLLIAALVIPELWNKAKGIGPQSFSYRLSRELQPPIDRTKLSQSYSYWAKGSQFYVFLSRDGQFVLKIPRAAKMGESLLARIFQRRHEKPSVLQSLAIAQKMRSMNSVIQVHYGQTDEPMFVELFDCLGRKIFIDLRKVPFALQKRQKLMSEALEEAHDSSEIKEVLTAYLDLVQSEMAVAVRSADSAFWLNFGYENGRASRLDVGSYVPLDAEFSWRKTAKPVCHYLKGRDSDLLKWFENQLSERER